MTWRSITARGGTAEAGIGLRPAHITEVMATRPAVGFLEVHAENYMSGSPAVAALEDLRRDYPISLHGVGLSLGSAGELDAEHLARFKALVRRIEPALISEHLAWSSAAGVYLNDLLPLPYTEETLGVVCRHVDEVQQAIGRSVLIENPSTYLRFRRSTIPEPEFMSALVERTGCGVLCDVNNIYVNAENFGFDPIAYIDALPADAVDEIHLAGHHRSDADGQTIVIDDHGSAVTEPVWRLYAAALERFGPVPTLIEWDTRIPALFVLLAEARKADRLSRPAAGKRSHRAYP